MAEFDCSCFNPHFELLFFAKFAILTFQTSSPAAEKQHTLDQVLMRQKRWGNAISRALELGKASGGFLSHRATHSHHPFFHKIFPEINPPFLGTPIYGTPKFINRDIVHCVEASWGYIIKKMVKIMVKMLYGSSTTGQSGMTIMENSWFTKPEIIKILV